MEKIDKEFWELMGFKKQTSVGGSQNWYSDLYFSDKYFYKNVPIFGGNICFNEDRGQCPKTKEELVKLIKDISHDYGVFIGKESMKSEFRDLLGLNS